MLLFFHHAGNENYSFRSDKYPGSVIGHSFMMIGTGKRPVPGFHYEEKITWIGEFLQISLFQPLIYHMGF